MTKPALDILLAVYNGERYIRPLLDSLLAQSFQGFRLIVSNNRSTDDTGNILREYRNKFSDRLLVLPDPETHISAQENFARVTEAGNADYIMYADGDDVWCGDKIEKTLRAMRDAETRYGNSTPLLVHSDLKVVDENLRCLHPSFWRYQFVDPRRTGLHQLILQNCVTGCTTMLNRPLFELGRPIPPEACVHDHWYALVASAFGQIVAIPESLIEYRQHGRNVTGAKRWGASYVMNHAGRLYSKDGARQTIDRNILQARIFLSRFERRLDPAQARVIGNFAGIRGQSALARRWSLVRNRFWKAGLVRNVGLFLVI
ncbi:MAG TPA: glycosyltransferase family 2 protein [Rhizomicrobium sp.]|jgi:glycosyltransferase involved in cell wall biosynthesis